MPQKNSRKEYGAGGHYHIYNRGIDKREIFLDQQDYSVFIRYMKFYLDKPRLQGLALKDVNGKTVPPSRTAKNYANEISLLAYCLMPNHFHFLIRQSSDRGIAEFMQSLVLKYVLYFNKKYHRVGSLFQSRYKTVLINNEEQFTYVTKYIHRNPLDILPSRPGLEGLSEYKYSSYGNYLGLFKQSWVQSEDILSYFSKTSPRNTYKSFVEESDDISMVFKEMIDLDE